MPSRLKTALFEGFKLIWKEQRLFLYTQCLQMKRRYLVRANLEESFCTHCYIASLEKNTFEAGQPAQTILSSAQI